MTRRFGLHFDDAKMPFLEHLFRRRVDAGPGTESAYLDLLGGSSGDDATARELGILAEALTVPETYFFRNGDQFRAFTEVCLPARLRARATARAPGVPNPRLRLVSAGCASGEEAYSLAILLLQNAAILPAGWDIERDLSIEAFDVNPAILAKATRAHYSPWALRETDPQTRARWFRGEGRDTVLADEVRDRVRFEQRNLNDHDPHFWWPETMDVVFCRNVLMYLTAEAAVAAVDRIARALAPGGYLFLGHAETLRGLSDQFHLCHTHGTFYYQRKEGPLALGPPADRDRVGSAWEQREARQPPDAVDSADSWIEVIQRAAERIQTLTATKPSAALETAAPAPTTLPVRERGASVEPALELLRQERFADALAVIRALPAEEGATPEAMLLHAVLLTHAGKLADAEALGRALLRRDELDAGAHYVLALCREGAGDGAGAAEHHRRAADLDPTFAMPRLHLGLLARRHGDLDSARRELGAALPLLGREDAARVLLFGGGFGREALVALCRAELASSGAVQ